MRPPTLSAGQSVAHPVDQTGSISEDFTNVTALSWPDAGVHPRYCEHADHMRLRAALQVEMGSFSFEALARLSWLIAELAA